MTKQTLNSQGFSVSMVILVLVTIATLAGGGWYVAHTQDTTHNGSPRVSQGGEDETPAANKYLNINEWGVRITLPEDLRGDISYYMNDRAQRDFGSSVFVSFLSKHISDDDQKCANGANGAPQDIVNLLRQEEGDRFDTTSSEVKVVGLHVYRIAESTPCSETLNHVGTTADKKLVSDIRKAILDSLEVIPQ